MSLSALSSYSTFSTRLRRNAEYVAIDNRLVIHVYDAASLKHVSTAFQNRNAKMRLTTDLALEAKMRDRELLALRAWWLR